MKIENLTLLSGSRNIQASDRPFNLSNAISSEEEKAEFLNEADGAYFDKLFVYNGKGIDGITKFRITQHIVDNYKEWNSEEMANRKTWVIKEIEDVLKIKLS
jgi:hypothetical protein